MKKKFLTSESKGGYSESLKTANTAFTPRQSGFFMPMAWTRAENNQYQPEHLLAAFSESAPLSYLTAKILKKANIMSNLSNIYQTYKNLHGQLKDAQKKELHKVSTAICDAIVALDTVIAYLPIESAEDKKIKIQALKDSICGTVTDFNDVVHEDALEPLEQEQLTIINQLLAAE